MQDFEKFGSLMSAHNQKSINIVNEQHGDVKYAVMEKIHGANFGVHLNCETNKIRFSRRKDFLEPGEAFCSYDKISEPLQKAVRAVNKMFYFSDESEVLVKEIDLRGEIFGGLLEGEKTEHHVTVKPEVGYSPSVNFALFSVKIDGKEVPPVVVAVVAQVAQLYYPLLGVAENLTEALAIENDMLSRVCVDLGHRDEPIEGNIMEGTVLLPWNESAYLDSGKRVIIKNKNSKFSEKGAKPPKTPSVMEPGDVALYETIGQYITENRLSNVLSKELTESLTDSDIPRIMGLLIADAMSEAREVDLDANPKELAIDWKKINGALMKYSRPMVLAWFKENVL